MKASDYLDHDELRQFTARSNFAGLALLVGNWAAIALIFSVVAVWSNIFTALAALLLLGGRQLGLAVLMHEAGHKTLFDSQRLNRTLGQWLAAYPVLGDCDAYGASHREHHRLAGTAEDPDLPNYRAYPVSAASFRRKLFRDLTGRTGLKLLLGTLRGSGNRIMMRDGEGTSAVPQGLIANAALFGVLWLSGHPALYLLWVGAYLTAYPLVARIRQVAEHGGVPALYERDPRGNTRTTRAGLLERMVLAPNHVNYHIEHHLLPSAPCWRLPTLHRVLRERGFYDEHPNAIADGYGDVIRRAVPELDHRSPTAA